MYKKGQLGLPAVALTSILFFTIILIFWTFYFFVIGEGNLVEIKASPNQLSDSSRLISLLNLPINIDGTEITIGELIIFSARKEDFSKLKEKLPSILEKIPRPTKPEDPLYSGWEMKIIYYGKTIKIPQSFILAGPTTNIESWSNTINRENLKQKLIIPKDRFSDLDIIEIELYLKCKCAQPEMNEYTIKELDTYVI